MKRGRQAAFFTLEYTEQEVLRRFREIGATEAQLSDLFRSDCSEDINAGYIMRAMSAAGAGSLVVVDYLQALDQKRTNPELAVQVRDLKAFARDRGAIVVLISQIHRSYDTAQKTCPDLRDVRLPNPLDVGLFDKSCFLNEGKVRIHAT
jgi:replicative DNA helicase